MYSHFLLARFNTDGTLDSEFNGGIFPSAIGGSYALIMALAIAPDGGLLAAGFSGPTTQEQTFVLARYIDLDATSINDALKPSSCIGVFPNPVSDRCALVFDQAAAGPFALRLLDATGRWVREFGTFGVTGPGPQRIELDLGDLAGGSYSLVLDQRGARSTVHLVKE